MLRPPIPPFVAIVRGGIGGRMAANESDPSSKLQRRAMLAVGSTLGFYVVSVATHLGEFWPFSIYPMFSRAGRPWTRAMMVDITDSPELENWGPWSLDDLPGTPFPTREVGVSANDLAKFVQLTKSWTDERISALRELYSAPLAQKRRLMLLKAEGRFVEGTEGREVSISLVGLVRLSATQALVNPQLEDQV